MACGPLAARGKLLAPEQREQLIDALLASLNEPALAELDAAWSGEIGRRLAAYDRGEVKAIPAEQVFAELRAIEK